tara:strand:- start:91 stop:258 length:168 start_codon:yes stop_codon:yes gene_type:complete
MSRQIYLRRWDFKDEDMFLEVARMVTGNPTLELTEGETALDIEVADPDDLVITIE